MGGMGGVSLHIQYTKKSSSLCFIAGSESQIEICIDVGHGTVPLENGLTNCTPTYNGASFENWILLD